MLPPRIDARSAQRLTPWEAVGCALILLGVIVVELGPGLLRRAKLFRAAIQNAKPG